MAKTKAHDNHQRRHGGGEGRNGDAHHPYQAETLTEPAGQLRHREEGDGIDREGEAVLHRRKTVVIDQHERRIGEIDQKARDAETADEGQRQEIAIAEQQAISCHRAAAGRFPSGPAFVRVSSSCVDKRISPMTAAIVTAQKTPRQP